MINLVNGYVCHNCTDVDYAKKGIDPAHPKKDDPLNPKTRAQNAIANDDKTQIAPAVILSGALAKLENGPDAVSSSTATNQNSSTASYTTATGTQLNISV